MPLPVPGTNDSFTAALRTQSLGMSGLSISAPTALATDVSVGGPDYYYLQSNTGNITSWVITGAVDGQRINLMINRTGVQTIVWPTNFKWANNTPPTLGGANTWDFYEFRYFASGTTWREINRSIGVP